MQRPDHNDNQKSRWSGLDEGLGCIAGAFAIIILLFALLTAISYIKYHLK